MIWFTSDLHFGHKNIIKYCNRPFTSIEEMNEYLINEWNTKVSDEDTVYCLGDFSLSPSLMCSITPKLKGYKILIPGNHDKCFDFSPAYLNRPELGRVLRKLQKETKVYLDAGWSAIYQRASIMIDKREVLLSHLPYASDKAYVYDDRYRDLRIPESNTILLHGHQHGHYKKNGNMIDVGMDAWDMKMVSLLEIIELIKSNESFVPSSITELAKERLKDVQDY